jgi:hypothetical protein
MRRLWALSLLLPFSLTSLVLSQSLGEVAEKEKERKKKEQPAGKSFTDADLPKRPPGKASPAPSVPPAPDPERDNKASEARWRAMARDRRVAISQAEKRVAEIQASLDGAGLDTDPNPPDAFDPNRLQKLEARKAELRGDLASAKTTLAAAQKAFENLEEDARRSSIPPGWLRE